MLNCFFLYSFSKVKKLTVKFYFKSQANILVSTSYNVKIVATIHLN